MRWALIRSWALVKFSPFSASLVCLFCDKTINGNNKKRKCKKARFLYNTRTKSQSSGGSLIISYLSLCGREWSGGGHLLTFSAFRMGTYSRWALIRGWALIRINTVYVHVARVAKRICTMKKNGIYILFDYCT